MKKLIAALVVLGVVSSSAFAGGGLPKICKKPNAPAWCEEL